jgi:hypothetical protein
MAQATGFVDSASHLPRLESREQVFGWQAGELQPTDMQRGRLFAFIHGLYTILGNNIIA